MKVTGCKSGTIGAVNMPQPVDLDGVGGAIRFGIGDPAGRCSASWRIEAVKNSRDIYIGPRRLFGTIKLSLHESGKWRLTYTEPAAVKMGLVGDRVIHRYEPTADVVPGWRLAMAIEIPESSLYVGEGLVAGASKVQWWPAPKPLSAIVFNVWITESDEVDQTGMLLPAQFVAGSFHLFGGGSVFVLVEAEPTDQKDHELMVTAARNVSWKKAIANGDSTDQDFFSWGMGLRDGLEIPRMVDLGNLTRVREQASH